MDKLEIIKGFFNANKRYYNELVQKKSLSKLPIRASKLFNAVHKESTPVFVLSTGRCGTELLTKIFRHLNSVVVYHEPFPEMLYHSKFAYENQEKKELLNAQFQSARYELVRNAFVAKKRYVETNNRITFFAPQIAELFPQAKFIHLVRNPESFVRSGIARNWYSDSNINDEGRIASGDTDVWNSFSTVEKCAWLWNETNSFVEDFKLNNKERVLSVLSENLFSKPDTTNQILDFLSLDNIEEEVLKQLIATPTNKGKSKVELSESDRQKILHLTPLRKQYNY